MPKRDPPEQESKEPKPLETIESRLDEALEESFPASDPPTLDFAGGFQEKEKDAAK